MKIAIGSDHGGFNYKEKVKNLLTELGHSFHDFGAYKLDPADDYPPFIRATAQAVASGDYERGIVLGGSGNGEAIVANKVKGIRCALCWSLDTARWGRKHNDANCISIGERTIPEEMALEIVKVYLSTPFEGGRHVARIAQIE